MALDPSAPPVVVITGASAGIGRATAMACAHQGWRVALLARGHAGLQAARDEVLAAGGQALVVPCDVAQAVAVHHAAEQVMQTWGQVDVWVNDAMVSVFGPARDIPPQEWQRVTAVTYLGAVHGTLAALHVMQPQDRGTIVQVGSALAYRSIPLQAPYCAAKAALRAFTDSLRSELLHMGSHVRLSMVHLPGVNTPQFSWTRTHMGCRHRPVGPVYAPEAAAQAIVKAALQAPRELWVGAPVIEALLGTAVAPGLLDRLLSCTAWTPQQGPAGDTQFDILDAPAGRDFGMAGPYPEGAHRQALAMNPAALRGGVALVLLAAAAAWLHRRSA